MRLSFTLTLEIFALLPVAAFPVASVAGDKPNLIVIFADDHGWLTRSELVKGKQ